MREQLPGAGFGEVHQELEIFIVVQLSPLLGAQTRLFFALYHEWRHPCPSLFLILPIL
jgi:hypothetical protein